MADEDEYETALTDTATGADGAESAPITRREPGTPPSAAQAHADAVAADESGELSGHDVIERREPGRQRGLSPKVRAMFQDLSKRAQASGGIEADDLVPMEHTSPPAAAAPVAAIVPPPTAQTPPDSRAAAAAAAPIAPPIAPPVPPRAPLAAPAPDVGKAAAEQAKLLADVREKAFAEREAKLAEREKLLPDAGEFAERPGATLVSWIKDRFGITDEAELKTVMHDVVTEMAEIGLGVKAPEDVKTGVEARKAVRSVKAYKAEQARMTAAAAAEKKIAEEKAAKEREDAETASRERQATTFVAQQLADPAVKSAHKFLHDATLTDGSDPAAIVIEVCKEQQRQGQPVDWRAAAKYADDYFRSKAEETAKKADYFRSLLAPAAPAPAVAPAPAAPAPGGAPGPAPRTQPTPAPAAEEMDSPLDLRDRRRQSLRAIVRKHKGAFQAE